jgi:sec-independent protein translocase protein TatB
VFGIGGWEFVVIGIVAMLVIGPEKLPRYATDAARMLRQLRRLATSAQDEVRKELGPEFQDFSITDLNPKRFVKKHLLDPDELAEEFRFDGLDDEPGGRSRGNGSPVIGSPAAATPNGQADEQPRPGPPVLPETPAAAAPPHAPFDPDAT